MKRSRLKPHRIYEGKHAVKWRASRKPARSGPLSKFKNIPGFGEWADGHILLQEHGSAVSFRDIKLRVLPGN